MGRPAFTEVLLFEVGFSRHEVRFDRDCSLRRRGSASIFALERADIELRPGESNHLAGMVRRSNGALQNCAKLHQSGRDYNPQQHHCTNRHFHRTGFETLTERAFFTWSRSLDGGDELTL